MRQGHHQRRLSCRHPAADDALVDPEQACQSAIEAGLVVHRAHPLNGETSVPALIGGVVVPNPHFYVRNHFHMPVQDRSTWRLRIGGLTDRPLSLSLRNLLAMPSQTQVVTLECEGNDRARLSPRVDGEQWQFGAVSTAEWSGVPLVEVLDRAGIKASACELVFRGADNGHVNDRHGTVSFERSLAVTDARGGPISAVCGIALPVLMGVAVGWYRGECSDPFED